MHAMRTSQSDLMAAMIIIFILMRVGVMVVVMAMMVLVTWHDDFDDNRSDRNDVRRGSGDDGSDDGCDGVIMMAVMMVLMIITSVMVMIVVMVDNVNCLDGDDCSSPYNVPGGGYKNHGDVRDCFAVTGDRGIGREDCDAGDCNDGGRSDDG
jgi:uncharacterized membrane protein